MLSRFHVAFYHSPCPDGDAAAYLLRNHAEVLIPYTYGKSNINMKIVENKDVLFVDVCPPEDALKQVKQYSKSVFVLDHHPIEDMCEKILGKGRYQIDKSVCGAVLVWNHYHRDACIPKWLQIINDYDTGQFKNLTKDDTAFHLAFCKNPNYAIKTEAEYKAYIEKGYELECERNLRVQKALDNSYTGNLGKLKVAYANVINVEDTARTANVLLSKYPDAAFAAVRKIHGTYCNFSLRRRSGDTISLQTIAKLFGGGGHEAASAVQVNDINNQFLYLSF